MENLHYLIKNKPKHHGESTLGFEKHINKRFNILILDDDFNILSILNKYLEKEPLFKVFSCQNPKEALQIINQNNVDLLLSDIQMPNMNGMELVTYIKENIKNKNLKIIMMTAYSTIDTMLSCETKGVNDYLTKPFISLLDVKSKIKKALNI
jgi:CheY-like chemotaxis protein